MTRSTTSIRLPDSLRMHLRELAADEGASVTELIERFVREGLASTAHPGVVFKAGPTGQRAALAGGPDVWEVLSVAREANGTQTDKVAALSKEFGTHERQVLIALDYAAEHRDEVEGRVRANDRALDETERVAAERERLLA